MRQDFQINLLLLPSLYETLGNTYFSLLKRGGYISRKARSHVLDVNHRTVALSKTVLQDSIAPLSPRQFHGRFWASVEFRVSSSCFDRRRSSSQPGKAYIRGWKQGYCDQTKPNNIEHTKKLPKNIFKTMSYAQF